MQSPVRHLIQANLALLSVLVLAMTGSNYQKQASLMSNSMRFSHSIYSASIGSTESMEHMTKYETYPNSMTWRIARRLRNRIRERYLTAPMLNRSAKAVAHRQWLLKRSAELTLIYPDSDQQQSWNVSVASHPEWIRARITPSSVSFELSEARIRETIERDGVPGVTTAYNVDLTEILGSESSDIVRVVTSDTATPGFSPDLDIAPSRIVLALLDESEQISLPLQHVSGRIHNKTDQDLGELVLLSSGKSNYYGSKYGRRFNVRKALYEHVHNVLVMPGEEFSFNDTLEGPVTRSNGWAEAKVIFGGSELRKAPGGGICQASTTVYRASVEAGLPVRARRAHSLFVNYYEKHGIGIDATIFPGSQDLAFTNDTGHPILIQAYSNSSSEAFVNIYGTPDGRSVTLAGPYMKTNAPDDLLTLRKSLHRNEIAWIQTVVDPNGNESKHVIASRYREIPNYIRERYGKRLLTALVNETE